MIPLSCIDGEEVHGARTLCLARRSFERAEDMILRRMDEGAEKCALCDLRREEETSGHRNDKVSIPELPECTPHPQSIQPIHPNPPLRPIPIRSNSTETAFQPTMNED